MVRGRRKTLVKVAVAAALSATLCLGNVNVTDAKHIKDSKGDWLSGDFHQHTLYTDGSTTFDFVMEKNNDYGLDWWANSEHGGERNRNGNGEYWDDRGDTILGSYEESGGHQEMWRWQSLRDYVFPDILDTRDMYPEKRIFSGLEWYVPGHEHCSVGVVDEDATAVSAFAYLFDASLEDFSSAIELDSRMSEYGELSVDTKRNGHKDWVQNATSVGYTEKTPSEQHADAVAASAWMQDKYDRGIVDDAWIIFAHIERNGTWATGGYNIEHFRDFNNAAPDICYGFEGAPGHQVNKYRGFGNSDPDDDFGGTYGGAGYYTAKVGGLWDALLGEGRRWFNFANSDYHRHYTAGGDDFYPGEYQKTVVYTKDTDGDGEYSLKEIAQGLRSGNSYFVHGDLVSFLGFEAQDKNQKVVTGGELKSKGTIKNLKLKIKFKSPESNKCEEDGVFITSCAAPVVDHIDLIAGTISDQVIPGTPEYSQIKSDAKVIASFTGRDWEVDKEGYHTIVYHLKNVDKSMYFRLRGTNLGCGVANETGPATELPSADYCSPLPDRLVTENMSIDGAQEAWDDLWFYSNPIFVYVD